MLFVLVSSLLGQTVGTKGSPVTVVAGESWLNHLHRAFDETSMGKTGRLGPPAPMPGEAAPRWQLGSSPGPASQTETLHGSDLYRLNCRGCHGESGLGAPPEINSVIDPVRASSVGAVMERMKTAGMNMSRADATKLALEAKIALLRRLHNGGQDMPPFHHLTGEEVRSLIAYLKQLAGLPGAKREQVAVKESPVRVGEHIVKSTCHICHSSSGPNPSAAQLSEGAIPPLNTLTSRLSEPEFVRKVTRGVPIIMGAPALPYRGRMPVFYYLSENEVADVYRYLQFYPPQEDRPAAEVDPSPKASMVSDVEQLAARRYSEGTDTEIVASVIAGLFVTMLLVGGFGFTVCEFMRLSAVTEGPSLAARNLVVKDEGADAANEQGERRLIA